MGGWNSGLFEHPGRNIQRRGLALLRVVTGPFHPILETALAEEIRLIKSVDAFASLTVVVPSDSLRRHLKRLLCLEHQCALWDVHFVTFYQFALRLVREAPESAYLQVRQEFFFQELVHQLLRQEGESPLTSWSDLVGMPGAWGPLLATLNDLKDARVDPERTVEALSQKEGGVSAPMHRLLTLYRRFLDERDRMQVVDQDDLAVLAESQVERSGFLARQHRILYYGFYDVTQVQLDLFQAVARAYPTTLFFPLIKGDPTYAFAQRFFDRYVYGMTGQEAGVDRAAASGSQPRGTVSPSVAPCRLLSVAGQVDEVTVVAKDILSLVEERGYAFQDIGVVARTLTGYERLLPRIFDQHAIPFTSTLSRPLIEWPYVKTLIQLVGLRVHGLRRDHVMAFLSSPFVRLTAACAGGSESRPDLWDLASQRLGITKGLDEWQRLTRYLDKDLPLREADEEDLTGPRIPAQHVRDLWQVVSSLAATLQIMPDQDTWHGYTEHVRSLAGQWLDVGGGGPAELSEQTTALSEQVAGALDELKGLRTIGEAVSLADFTAAFQRLMVQRTLPLEVAQGNGVQVLDAMAARGVSFRALYVLGLNEKVFPRHIQEDAFLRDSIRRFLEVDLGFKIQEKLGGFDEERLLFSLLCGAARDRLTLLYQRADETGRSLLPSNYLIELKRASSIEEQTAPLRLSSKFQESPFYHLDRLTSSEVSIKLLLERRVPRRLLTDVHPAGQMIERGLIALRSLEMCGHRLGNFDGLTGPLDSAWRTLTTTGVSPSALQEYAVCPFRYFAKQVLRLRPLLRPETVVELGPMELGTLAHGILRRCLETLKGQSYFADPSSGFDPMAVLNEAARVEFEWFAATQPVGYPLVWALQRERLLEFLRRVLRDDLDEMSREGWEPVLFEADLRGRLPPAVALSESSQDPAEDIAVVGRLDRVDWHRVRNAYRIIDYKFKASRKPDTLDKNLRIGAVRASRLQPPLYLALAPSLPTPASHLPLGTAQNATCEAVWFYYLAPEWDLTLTRVSFPGDAWSSDLKGSLTHALSHVLSGIRAGRFFIYASGSCDRCDYRLLCRRTHEASVWRARTDYAVVGPYRSLRSAAPPKIGKCAVEEAE